MAGSGTAHLRPAEDDIVLRVEDLVVEYHVAGGTVQAVSGLSFDVRRGETLGLVGESGCGKSTTGRAVMMLPRPSGGSVRFGDREMTGLSKAGSSSRLVLFLRHHGIEAGSSSSGSLNTSASVSFLRAARSSASGSCAPNR